LTKTIVLEADEYSEFMRCLSNLKDICNDADIRDGIIRQRSNDRTIIFEMDLKPLIQDATLPITDLKRKLDLLKIFTYDAVTIEINQEEDEAESYFTFSDSQTALKFSFPHRDFLDNQIIDQEELDSLFYITEDDLLLHDELNSTITERIKVVSANFHTQVVQIRFETDKASITAATQSKDQFAVVKSDIMLNMTFDGNFYANLTTLPFGIDHDSNVVFSMYKDPKQDVLLNKVSTEVGPVSLNIYSRSSVMKDE